MLTLFYAAGASSMASHILLQASGLEFTGERVNLMTKQWSDGAYLEINEKAYVPALRIPSGDILTEGAVILSYIADLVPEKRFLSSYGSFQRYKEMEWLSFISTELHKNVITPERHGGIASNFLSKTREGQEQTLIRVAPRLRFMDRHLDGHAIRNGTAVHRA